MHVTFPSDGIFHNGAMSSVPDQDPDDRSIFEIRRRRACKYRSSSSSVREVSGGIFSTTDIKELKLSRRCECFSFNSNHFIDYTTTCIKCLSHGTTTTAFIVFWPCLGWSRFGRALSWKRVNRKSNGCF